MSHRLDCAAVERLDPRRLLAGIAPDLTYGVQGVAAGSGFFSTIVGLQSDGTLIALNDQSGTQFIQAYDALGQPKADHASPFIDLAIHVDGAIDAQDRLVFAAQQDDDPDVSAEPLTLRRYSAKGEIDTSFGTSVEAPIIDGRATTSWTIMDMTLDASGRTLVAMQATLAVKNDVMVFALLLYRFSTSGKLDTSFGAGGRMLVTTLANNGLAEVKLGTLGDRPAVLMTPRRATPLLAVFTNRGALDTSFADAGYLALGSSRTFSSGLIVDRQDRLVISQPIRDASGEVTATSVTRYTASGQVDTSFGNNGTTIVPGATIAEAYELSLDGSDRIVGAAGILVFRLRPDGTLDTAFTETGVLKTSTIVLSIQPADNGIFISGIQLLNVRPDVVFDQNTLYLTGNRTADNIVVEQIGSNLRVTFNGKTYTHAAQEITRISAELNGGADKLDLRVDLESTVNAGAGNDTILAGDARDNIETGAGDDSVSAGGGNDEVTNDDGADDVDFGTGDISFRSAAPQAQVITGTVASFLYIEVGDGDNSITLSGGDAVGTNGGIRTGNGNNFISAPLVSAGPIGDLSIITGDGDDVITASDGNDDINSGSGNDKIYARAGDDSILAGDGNDIIEGAAGADFIQPQLGDDRVTGDAGNDLVIDSGGKNTIDGGDGADSIKTGAGDDSLTGGLGKDTIRAGPGDDFVDGGGGQDQLHGLAGDDTIWGGGNNDRLFGGPGGDSLVGNAGDDYFIDHRDALDSVTIDTLDGGTGVDRAFIDDEDVAASIETLRSAI